MSSSPQGNPFADWLKQQNPDYHREIEGDFDVDAAMNAIQSHEADTPLTRNRDSGATGYYQIMPDNIKAWSKEILGREYSVEEFQNDPAAQDRVAREKIKQYAKARGGDVREVLKD